MAQEKKLFAVETTIVLAAFRRFNVDAVEMKQAVAKADRIIKAIDPNAEVIKVELLDTKLLDE